MFWAVWRAAVAMAAQAAIRSGKLAAHSSACMPPIEPPTTAASRSIPSACTRAACARTMSPTVMTGKFSP